jgi:hypothetical protein
MAITPAPHRFVDALPAGVREAMAEQDSGGTHSITHCALDRLEAAGLAQPLETRREVQRALDVVSRELVRP